MLFAMLVATALGAHAAVPLEGQTLTLLDVAALLVTGAMALAVSARAVGNLRALARREPVRRYNAP
jgi:hypothetical protein